MDPPDFSAGGRPSPKLQGPRPTPLKVNKDSYKIKKPPVAPQLPNHHAPPQQAASEASQSRQTVVIYTVSPKVIHSTASDFMDLVQRLTGQNPRPGDTPTEAGNISPAVRVASIEKASPSERDREREREKTAAADDFRNIMEILQQTSSETSQIPGILTSDPATLAPISPAGLYSPGLDPFLTGNPFIPSPSMLRSPPLVSPNPWFDLFNSFDPTHF